MAIACGLVATGVLWPDLTSPSAHDSSLGLIVVLLSFLLGQGSLLLAYAPAVLGGVVVAIVSYVMIRIASRTESGPK